MIRAIKWVDEVGHWKSTEVQTLIALIDGLGY